MRFIKFLFLGLLLPLLASCSSDYVNVIPSGATALMSFDMASIAQQTHIDEDNKQNALKKIFHVDDVTDCGLDLTEKLYAFETADGQLGMVAKVSSESTLEDWIDRMVEAKICSPVKEKKGFNFTVLHQNFLVGYSSDALLIMGPAVGAAQGELQRQMIRYLKADEEDGVGATALFERLESINSPVALVAQTIALPEKFVAPFTIGAPKGCSPEDILIAAEMTVKDKCLNITGETFSFNQTVDKQLKAAAAEYLPIDGKYLKSIPDDALAAVMMGIDGKKYIKQLRNNTGMRSMLVGLNTVIDIDMMLKSIKGDMLLMVPSMQGDKMEFQLAAQAADAQWLDDVEYWKQSCPKGCKIMPWKNNAFHFVGNDWNTYFGFTSGRQLFFASNALLATTAGSITHKPLSDDIQNQLKGKRMVAVFSVAGVAKQKEMLQTLSTLMNPVFGDITKIIYTLK